MGYVIFRLDDVQDGWLIEPQSAIINLFLQHPYGPLPISLGLIGGSFQKKTDFHSYLNDIFHKNSGICELVCHSFTHTDFSTIELTMQRNEIKQFLQQMDSMFPGQEVSSFIPPFNRYTSETIDFLKDHGIEIVSGADGRYEDKDLFSSPAFMHASITTNDTIEIDAVFRNPKYIINDIANNIKHDTDWCVVMMHPQEFSIDRKNIVNPSSIEGMGTVIDWCLSSGHTVVNMKQMLKQSRTAEYAIKYFQNAI